MRRIHSNCLFVSGAAFAFAAGCSSLPSVGPDYEEPSLALPEVTLPDAGSPTTNLTASLGYHPADGAADRRIVISKDAIAQWWNRFDDPVLTGLVEGAQTNNLPYQAALRRLEAADYEVMGARAAYLPAFAVGGGWQRSWRNRNTTGNPTGENGYNLNSKQIALDGDWEIDIFGGNRRRTEAALARAEAARWTADDLWISLTSQIGAEYIRLRTIQARLDVARTNLVLQSETYDILKASFDSGIGNELSVNQCAYIVEQTRANIPQLLAAEEASKNALAIFAGRTPGELEELLAPLATARDWLLPPQKVAEIPLDLMRARPDVKIAERELAAATAEIGVAKSLWFPRLSLNGSIGFDSSDSKTLFSKDSFLASLGPSVSWPIFRGGAIYANLKAAEKLAEAAALNYELAIRSAYGEVRDAYSAYTQEYHRCQALAAAVKAAADAVAISQDLHKNGLAEFNNVLDAQRSLLQCQEAYVVSRGQITLDLIALYRALGGGLAVERP